MVWMGTMLTGWRASRCRETCPRFVHVAGWVMSDNQRLSDGGLWAEVGGLGVVR